MKKHILPLLLSGAMMSFAPSQMNAQIRNDRGTFNMPCKGDMLIETQARLNLGNGSLFDLNDGFLWNLDRGLSRDAIGATNFTGGNYYPMLKTRSFINHNTVFRMLTNISYGNRRINGQFQDTAMNNFGIALGLGIEKIFHPAERLNTYMGADLMLGYANVNMRTVNVHNNQGAFGLGVRMFTGMDYYVLPKVYLGLELGWGLSYNYYGMVHTMSSNNNRTLSNFTLTPYVTPQLRLGYVLGMSKKHKGHNEPSYRSKDNSGDDE
ncbi:MAG: hypothetical protein JSS78_05515 [Bacteroidetes bacterium]|nr:hypothetical protein [Bacteroidota bacterium]